jgi:pimeloyl-ACP methyl ester carboxylesterase
VSFRRTESVIGERRLHLEHFTPDHPNGRSHLLAIHGAFDGSWVFARFAPILASMGWHVHCLNLRGYYKSRWKDVAPLGVADYVDDIARVRHALHLRDPILVGYSVGGILAMKSAERDGAGGVILYDSTPPREYAERTRLPPSRDFMDRRGQLPPVLQFIPTKAIVEEMWGRRVSEKEFQGQLRLFRQSYMSGRSWREIEVDRVPVARLEIPTLLLSIARRNPPHEAMYRDGLCEWFIFEGYSHGSLLVNPKADRITRMVMSWLRLGMPTRRKKVFVTVPVDAAGPKKLLARGGSFGRHDRKFAARPGAHLAVVDESMILDLRYLTGWQSPIVRIESGGKAFETPLHPIGGGRRYGERLVGARVEFSHRHGLLIRGENGEDRPPGGGLYRPELSSLLLADGEFFERGWPAERRSPHYEEIRLRSPELEHDFHAVVRLPRDYDPHRTYPVAILNDGQNQWTNRGAKGGWHTDMIADRLARDGRLRDLILVGVVCHRHRNKGYLPPPFGRVDLYADFLADRLLPHLRHRFRIATNPSEIAIIGASYGANAAVAVGIKRPDVFGLVGALSFAWVKGNPQIAAIIGMKRRPFRRLYADCGTRWAKDQRKRDDFTGVTRKLIHAASERWMTHGKDLLGLVAEGHYHDEIHWRKRIGGCLRFLFRED